MDTGRAQATATEDSGVLGLEVEEYDSFKSVYDAPFITVNLVDGDLVGLVEVHPSNDQITRERVATAVAIGEEEGFRFHAARPADFADWLQIFFSPGDGEA